MNHRAIPWARTWAKQPTKRRKMARVGFMWSVLVGVKEPTATFLLVGDRGDRRWTGKKWCGGGTIGENSAVGLSFTRNAPIRNDLCCHATTQRWRFESAGD